MKKKEQNKKRFPVLTVIFCVLILGALGVYAGGVFYYQNHFVNGTVIDKADVSRHDAGGIKRSGAGLYAADYRAEERWQYAG